jgi:hypothetical protein
MKVLAAFGILGSQLGYAETSSAKQNPTTAIDIALEPDATMIQHAEAVNARLRKAFSKGFALDATHDPHISIRSEKTQGVGIQVLRLLSGKKQNRGPAAIAYG